MEREPIVVRPQCISKNQDFYERLLQSEKVNDVSDHESATRVQQLQRKKARVRTFLVNWTFIAIETNTRIVLIAIPREGGDRSKQSDVTSPR